MTFHVLQVAAIAMMERMETAASGARGEPRAARVPFLSAARAVKPDIFSVLADRHAELHMAQQEIIVARAENEARLARSQRLGIRVSQRGTFDGRRCLRPTGGVFYEATDDVFDVDSHDNWLEAGADSEEEEEFEWEEGFEEI